MASGSTFERVPPRVAELATRDLDLQTFWHEVTEVLAPAVPHFMAPCWWTLDPASLLITSHFNEEVLELAPEILAQEYYDDDVNQLADVARSSAGLSTLHEATHGDPASSPRWHANMAMGGDQEMIAALRTRSGETWGAVGLYRAPGEPLFDQRETALIRTIAADLAAGARRALLFAEAREEEGPEAPGLVVLDARWELESSTPGVERWLDEMPGGDWAAGRLPAAVLAVAGRARRLAERRQDGTDVAVARVMCVSGVWVVLHGAALTGPSDGRTAVIVEPAHPARIVPLLMTAYGLSPREQEVVVRVLQGDSTAMIAGALVVSPHTVQQHLKSIFEKTGVRSRRELVGKVFFSFYEPRVRDNEQRVRQERPLRGGPLGG